MLFPASRKVQEVQCGCRVGEYSCLLVGTLMKPIDFCGWSVALYGTSKTSTTIVTLDKGYACAVATQHLGNFALGYLHWLSRIDNICYIYHSVGIYGIAYRAEIVVAHIGCVGVVGITHNVAWQGVVLGKRVAIEQSFA